MGFELRQNICDNKIFKIQWKNLRGISKYNLKQSRNSTIIHKHCLLVIPQHCRCECSGTAALCRPPVHQYCGICALQCCPAMVLYNR